MGNSIELAAPGAPKPGATECDASMPHNGSMRAPDSLGGNPSAKQPAAASGASDDSTDGLAPVKGSPLSR